VGRHQNLVHSSKFGSRSQPHDEMLKFLTLKMADDRHIVKCWKCCSSPSSGPIWTKLEWSRAIMSPTCLPSCCCHGNGRYLATFSSYWHKTKFPIISSSLIKDTFTVDVLYEFCYIRSAVATVQATEATASVKILTGTVIISVIKITIVTFNANWTI